MVLKKQTVWLLTMLSLIVVLSVYYLTSPGQSPDKMVIGDKQATEKAKKGKDQKVVTTTATEDKLAEYELEKTNEMSKLEKKYQGIITSEKSSTEQVSKAYDSLEALKTLANNEKMLEDVIKSKGYANAVVQASGHEVQVFVSSDKLSNKQANGIMKLANEYLGTDKMVSVDYALTEKK